MCINVHHWIPIITELLPHETFYNKKNPFKDALNPSINFYKV